jgi:hypothetical protein
VSYWPGEALAETGSGHPSLLEEGDHRVKPGDDDPDWLMQRFFEK